IEKTVEHNTSGRHAHNVIIETVAQQKQQELQKINSLRRKEMNL
ncbi:5593_t:CDS:1, partial [Gigaspora margarita]